MIENRHFMELMMGFDSIEKLAKSDKKEDNDLFRNLLLYASHRKMSVVIRMLRKHFHKSEIFINEETIAKYKKDAIKNASLIRRCE